MVAGLRTFDFPRHPPTMPRNPERPSLGVRYARLSATTLPAGASRRRIAFLLAVASSSLIACNPGSQPPGDDIETDSGTSVIADSPEGGIATDFDTSAIADSLRALIERAYDFSRPGVVERLMSLYPDNGPVVSAAAGRVTSSRDSLRAQIVWFWDYVGQNMQQPRWEWTSSHVRVLGPDAAVLTASYRVPHRTPEGRPHVVGGAWTMVFQRQNGRWVIVQEHLSDVPDQSGNR